MPPSRAIERWLSWRVEALEDALARHGKPEIFNTDQGSQFTGAAFAGVLIKNEIAVSMDALENDFLEGALSKAGLLSARR